MRSLLSATFFLLAIAFLNCSATAQSQDNPAPTTHYSGTVVDAQGNPVAGASLFSTNAQLIAIGEKQPVDSKTKTDSDGNFRLPIYGSKRHAIGVFKKGFAFCIKSFNNRSKQPANRNLLITLVKPRIVDVEILTSDGKPAEIQSASLDYIINRRQAFRFYAYRDLPVKTAFPGNRLTIDLLQPNDLASIEISCAGHTPQSISITKDDAVLKTARLKRSGFVEGVVTSDGKPIANSRVVVRSIFTIEDIDKKVDSSLCRISKTSETHSDADGKFRIETIEGTAGLSCDNPRTGTSGEIEKIQVIAGETLTQNLICPSPIIIRGKVVDEQGNGVEGVHLGSRGTVTDMMGNFEYQQKSAAIFRPRLTKIPAGFGKPVDNRHRSISTRPGKTEYVLEDIVLPYSRPAKGIVVDESGEPIKDATLICTWRISRGNVISISGESVQTDEDGRFVAGKALDGDLAIYATSENAASAKVKLISKSENRDDLRIVISSKNLMTLSGKISNTHGQPISSAAITVFRRLGTPWSNYPELGQPLKVDCRTDATGRFEFSLPLKRCEFYSCKVSAPGYVGRKIDNLTIPESGDPKDLLDFRLESTRTIRGVVVDQNEKPVPGARVWSHPFVEQQMNGRRQTIDFRNHPGSSSETDTNGKFELTGIHDSASFVFADKDGFQLQGSGLGSGTDPVSISLITDRDLIEPLRLIEIAQDSRRLAVNRLADFALAIGGEKPSSHTLNQLLDSLLLIDQTRVGAMMNDMDWGSGKAQWHAALGNHQEAIETALGYENPSLRFRTLIASAERVSSQNVRVTMLVEAAFQLDRIANAATRVAYASNLIGELLDHGEVDIATELADSIKPVALAMDDRAPNAFTKARFAKALVRIDYHAALELIETGIDLKDSDSTFFHRFVADMADELAAENPERAIEVLNRIPDRRRDRYIPRIACRMATVDPEKAIKLLESGINSRDHDKSNGMAAMAFLLKDSHPEKAARLIDQAFEALLSQFPHSDRRIGVILNMLRYEMHVTGGTKHFWSIAEQLSDPNPRAGFNRAGKQFINQAELALLLTLFDREPIARSRLCDALAQHFENPSDEKSKYRNHDENAIAIAAMALHDPERIATTIKAFHENTPPQFRRGLPIPWTVAMKCLANDGESIVDFLAGEIFSTWTIGKEN